jgi:4-azaleucine resistance transporter AzlC
MAVEHSPNAVRLTARGVWRGAVEIAPIALFVLPFGIAFGAAAAAKAIPPAIAVFMSAAVCAGASQFAALDLWLAPLPLGMLAVTVLAVNARHVLLGATLAPWLLQLPLARRLLALSLLSDANFAQSLAAHERGETDAGVLFGGGFAMWITWVLGTAIGATAGTLLGDLSRFGFDAVMATYFVAILCGRWQGRRDLVPWATAAIVAVVAARLLAPGWHIIAGALAGGLAGALRHGK